MSDEPTIDKSERRIRKMFGEISPRYDLLNHLLSCGVDVYWRWRTVRTVPPEGDAPILDVCSGTADLALAYRNRCGGSAPVIGTDFSHEMLVLARQKFRRRVKGGSARQDLTETAFVEADTQELPFQDDHFQIVSVAFGLRNVTDTERGLREMARVCQPNGTVVVLEFSLPENPWIRYTYQWYFRHILPRIGQLLARNRQHAYHYLPQSVSEFPQGAQLAAIMERCGLTAVKWKPLTFGIATLYWGKKPATPI